ncbi:MAG: ABC transporter ATP-binding protein [Thermoanaerobaculia bacterium]
MSWAVRAERVSKRYRRTARGFQLRTLKSALLGRRGVEALAGDETIAAVESVSFEIERGEAFGIVGGNGSGKSTLLKMIAGILKPTTGTLETAGRVAALIELGAGFHPEISGRENIFINGAVLGLSKRQIAARYDRIVEFSGLADFLEEPVKNYSSGMYVRLGFAVAIHTDPEILLVDEVLAVGDEAFAHRCLRRIEEFLASGRTVIFVSHSLGLVEEICSRVLWLDEGHVRLIGEPRRVVDAYRQDVAEDESRAHRDAKEEREREEEGAPPAATAAPETGENGETGEVLRWGSGAAEIVAVHLRDAQGVERYHFASGDPVTFELEAQAASPLADIVFGVGLFSPRGVEVWGTNTDIDGFESEHFAGRVKVVLECPSLRLAAGEYLVDVALHAKDGAPYDYRRKLLAFTVTSATGGAGVYLPEHSWRFAGTPGPEAAESRPGEATAAGAVRFSKEPS